MSGIISPASRRAGFGLIEMLVALTIAGILVGWAVPASVACCRTWRARGAFTLCEPPSSSPGPRRCIEGWPPPSAP
ncbi:MAG: prepilin-type N-terminal cleavage/methylation domain-containing protein [Gammaproteobacteria bacterium]|nr:prepilin-type N-terminal cleavage/methylation domain-containing protein [Gammaproteobacteria bacterium]